VRLIGLLLLAGAALSLALHFTGAPEDFYRWSYHQLLSGLDVPREPSQATVDAVGNVSLIGGLVELAAGTALLAWAALRRA